ncbi:MAG: cytidylate kinase-like family protein [Chthoniobacterales bacterium]
MSETDYFAKYRAYFVSQKDRSPLGAPGHLPFVTVSRQAGAGAETVASLLAAKLNAQDAPGAQPWTVFDKNLIDRVLADQDLPQEIAKLVEEDKDTTIKAIVGELLGLHPSMWTIFHHTSDTILKLARLGRCIMVGRGGNIVTAKLKGGIHVRLVAPENIRLAHLIKRFGLDEKSAGKYLHEHDEGRRRYVKTNFERDIEDPLLYGAVLNTGLLGFEKTADLLAAMVTAKK